MDLPRPVVVHELPVAVNEREERCGGDDLRLAGRKGGLNAQDSEGRGAVPGDRSGRAARAPRNPHLYPAYLHENGQFLQRRGLPQHSSQRHWFVGGVWSVVERDGDHADGVWRNARTALRGSGCGFERHPLAEDGDADAPGLVALVAHGDPHLANAGEIPGLRADGRQHDSRPFGRLEATRGKRQRFRRRIQHGGRQGSGKDVQVRETHQALFYCPCATSSSSSSVAAEEPMQLSQS